MKFETIRHDERHVWYEIILRIPLDVYVRLVTIYNSKAGDDKPPHEMSIIADAYKIVRIVPMGVNYPDNKPENQGPGKDEPTPNNQECFGRFDIASTQCKNCNDRVECYDKTEQAADEGVAKQVADEDIEDQEPKEKEIRSSQDCPDQERKFNRGAGSNYYCNHPDRQRKLCAIATHRKELCPRGLQC